MNGLKENFLHNGFGPEDIYFHYTNVASTWISICLYIHGSDIWTDRVDTLEYLARCPLVLYNNGSLRRLPFLSITRTVSQGAF